MANMNLSSFNVCLSNESTKGTLDAYILASILVEVILAGVISVGNILVLMAVSKFKEPRTALNVYTVSLAWADLSVGLVALPVHMTMFIFPSIQSVSFVCVLRFCTVIWSCSTSVFMLSLIAVDRYWAIEKPLLHKTKMTTEKAKLICIVAWAIDVVFCYTPLFGWNKWSPCSECIPILVLPRVHMLLSQSFLMSCIASVGIINFKIFITADKVCKDNFHRKVSRQGQDPVDTGARKNFIRNIRAVKTLTIMFGAFALCVLPFSIFVLWEIYSGIDTTQRRYTPMRKAFVSLVVINSALNPIIYNHRVPEFNTAFRKLLRLKPRNGPHCRKQSN